MEMSAVVTICRVVIETQFDSSDSDSDNDAEILLACYCENEREEIPKIQNYIAHTVPRMSDKTFKSHFRIERSTADNLMDLLGLDLSTVPGSVGRCPTPIYTQILMGLWMMATPDSHRSVCERFNIGNATGWRTVWRFVGALYKYLLTFIKWHSNQEALVPSDYVQRRFGFLGVIGVVDGTHVAIAAPHVVCDHTLKCIHVYAGEVGSVHDSRVFRLLGLQDLCTPANFPPDSHLLGDQAYILQLCAMVPYKNNRHLDNAELYYNTVHSSARMMVERSIGLLEGRFRSLLYKQPVKRTDLISFYIVACCVLHNIRILQIDSVDIPILVNNNFGNPRHAPQVINNALRIRGVAKKNEIEDDINV